MIVKDYSRLVSVIELPGIGMRMPDAFVIETAYGDVLRLRSRDTLQRLTRQEKWEIVSHAELQDIIRRNTAAGDLRALEQEPTASQCELTAVWQRVARAQTPLWRAASPAARGWYRQVLTQHAGKPDQILLLLAGLRKHAAARPSPAIGALDWLLIRAKGSRDLAELHAAISTPE